MPAWTNSVGNQTCAPAAIAAPAREDEAFLSHSYWRETVVISVSGTPGTDYWPYLRDVDRWLGEFDARVHRGKLHSLDGVFLNAHLAPC